MGKSDDIVYKNIEDLELDLKNPRLPHSVKKDEKSILTYMASSTSLEDLMDAIAKNGYFPGEPLVVVTEGEKLVVVEGNRRLSSVKLLNNPYLIDNPSRFMREISESLSGPINELPVVVKETRSEVLPYLGFRHITGVKQWDPLSKSRYMKQLFDHTDEDQEPYDRYKDVARSIGSRADHIKRGLDALAVYDEIERNDFYGIDGLDEESIKFAVLSTALADDRIGSFVGTSSRDEDGDAAPTHPVINPEALDKEKVSLLTSWLFKKGESGKSKVGESRNLKLLGAVLDSPHSKSAFMGGSSLDYAYRLSKGSDEELLQLLYDAEVAITRSASLVATTEFSQEALDVTKSLRDNISLIGKTLQSKRVDDDEF